MGIYYQRRPKPLSRRERSSEVKNIAGEELAVVQGCVRDYKVRGRINRFLFYARELHASNFTIQRPRRSLEDRFYHVARNVIK